MEILGLSKPVSFGPTEKMKAWKKMIKQDKTQTYQNQKKHQEEDWKSSVLSQVYLISAPQSMHLVRQPT